MDWRSGDRAEATLMIPTMLMATTFGDFKGEHAMLVVLSIGLIVFLYAVFGDLRNKLDKLRDKLQRLKQ